MSENSEEVAPGNTGAFGPTIESSSPTSSAQSITIESGKTSKKTDTEILSSWLNQDLVDFQNGNGNLVEIKIREFLEITNTDTDVRGNLSWFESDSIDIAMALLTQNYQRDGDMCVLRAYEGCEVFHIGRGAYGFEDKGTESIVKAVRSKTKRWIIIPVTDGILHGVADAEEKERLHEENKKKNNNKKGGTAASTSVEKPDKSVSEMHPSLTGKSDSEGSRSNKKKGGEPTHNAFGAHWGLLIVDKKTRQARWIDSHLGLKESKTDPRKQVIHEMFRPGEAAALILCGIERILGAKSHSFTAKTAKYVPHQKEDNSFKGDPGASCGPYMIAFLEYLYQNPVYLQQLDSAFRVESWKHHKKALAFDSLQTRIRMQDMIQRKSEAVLGREEKPLKMSPEVFAILRPKVLAPLVATAWRSYEGRRDKVNFDDFHFRGNKRAKKRGRTGMGGGGGGGGRGTNDDDDYGGSGGGATGGGEAEEGYEGEGSKIIETDEEDADDSFIYDPEDPKAASVSKQLLRLEIRSNPTIYVGIETKTLKYRRAYEIQAAALVAESNKPAEPTEAKRAAGPKKSTKPAKLSQGPPRPSRHPILQYPEGIEEAPHDFADTTEVPSERVKRWRLENIENIKKCGLGKKARDDGLSVRAILQVLSGVQFTKESDYRLTNIWINDPEVFNGDDRNDIVHIPGVIAQRLQDKYEIFDMTDLPKEKSDSSKKRPRDDEGEGHVAKKAKAKKK